MTGKHELRPAPGSGGSNDAVKPSAPSLLRMLAASSWRQLTGTASAAVGFCLVACACCLVAVAGPRAGTQLRTTAFQHLAATTPAADTSVIGTLDAGSLSSALNQQVGADQIALATSMLRRNLAKTLPLAPAGAQWSGMTTPFTVFPDRSRAVGSDITQLELLYRDDLSSHVRVVAGSLPSDATSGSGNAPVQIAVTDATARRFGWRVGSDVSFEAAGMVLRVTGIVAPVGPGGPFWTLDPVAAAPVVVEPAFGEPFWQGGAFVSGTEATAVASRFAPSQIQLTWTFPLALGGVTGAQAAHLSVALPTALASAGQLVVSGYANVANVTLTSGALNLLDEFSAQDSAVSSLLDLMSVSLAVVGAVVVLLVAWLMAERRREEFAVLRARGASRRQLAHLALWGSAVTALPGGAVGIALADLVTPGADAPLGRWLAGLTLLTAIGGPVLITLRMHRGYAAIRPGRPVARTSSLRRLVAEAAFALASVGGLVALRYQTGQGRSGDLYASAAPALAAIPVAIVMMRLYPLLVRPLLRLAARRSGVTAFLGLARAAGAAATAALPVVAMVLALSLVSFAGMVRGAVVRGQEAQAWQETGADAVVSVPSSLTPGQQRAIATLPGVQHAVPVAISAARSGAGTGMTVLFASPAQYAALLDSTPLGPVPVSFASWRGVGNAAAGVPALASPGLFPRRGGQPIVVTLQDGQQLRIRAVGTAPSMSAVTIVAAASGVLVVPRSAAGAYSPAVNTMLVAGANLNDGLLRATVARWHVSGALAVLRAQLQSALADAPLQRGAYFELAVGGAVAAIAAMLVLLLTLMLSAQSRRLTLTRATTMGLSSAQGRRLALIEALPQVVAVLAGGVVTALVLVPLIGPALGLSVFTGSASSVPVRIEPAWLAGTTAALLVVALATLAAQTALASRSAPRSLRIGG